MDALIERCEQGPRRQMIAVVGMAIITPGHCGCIKARF